MRNYGHDSESFLVKMHGDAQLDQFYHEWMEMCSNMLPEDVPPEN